MKIEYIKGLFYIDGRIWSKKKDNRDIGDKILNILFYNNQEGKKEYTLFINGIDETEEFKKSVYEKYKDIPNQELAKRFYLYSNIKENEFIKL